MADWSGILRELQQTRGDFDGVRGKYLRQLQKHTGRMAIAYYSGWLQKPVQSPIVAINDFDKNAFMATMKGLDKNAGLDLLLHTPGGDVAATESIIDYLCTMFSDIRVIVPQLAMSGGTMIACAADKIVMGKHSSLGPIDPQLRTPFGQVPAHGILEEVDQAVEDIKRDPARQFVWSHVLSKYTPTLLGECKKAIDWAEQIASARLKERMFADLEENERDERIDRILEELGNHAVSLSHGRHLSVSKCEEIGLKIEKLEDDQKLQEIVLSIHHAMMHTLGATEAIKITENHKGSRVVQKVPIVQQSNN